MNDDDQRALPCRDRGRYESRREIVTRSVMPGQVEPGSVATSHHDPTMTGKLQHCRRLWSPGSARLRGPRGEGRWRIPREGPFGSGGVRWPPRFVPAWRGSGPGSLQPFLEESDCHLALPGAAGAEGVEQGENLVKRRVPERGARHGGKDRREAWPARGALRVRPDRGRFGGFRQKVLQRGGGVCRRAASPSVAGLRPFPSLTSSPGGDGSLAGSLPSNPVRPS